VSGFLPSILESSKFYLIFDLIKFGPNYLAPITGIYYCYYIKAGFILICYLIPGYSFSIKESTISSSPYLLIPYIPDYFSSGISI
jgi:hypothetical protein